MPNWCNNSLQLTAASKEEATEIYNLLETLDSDTSDEENAPTFFGHFVPEQWDENEWYWSRVEAWGTKWDASIHSWGFIDDFTVVISFDTAWSPPIGVYNAMVEQGWGVSATYYEPGMCFVGAWVDGVEEHYEYALCETPEAIREMIGEDLDDEYGISDMMQVYLEEEKEYEESNG